RDARDITSLRSSPRSGVAREAALLAARLQEAAAPAVLILDDIHRVTSRAALGVIERIIERLPAGTRVALAGRAEPDLPLARYRADRLLLELSLDSLALDEAEAAALVAGVGCELEPAEVSTLVAQTEGWPAATYLAALAMRDAGADPHPADAVSGGDPYIAAYLRSELQREFAEPDLAVLTRTAVLETITPGSSDAVAGVAGADERLRTIADQNHLIQRVGPAGSFRYHHILRGYLLAELERREPGTTPDLHRTAARWYRATGHPFDALEHAAATDDWVGAAESLTAAAPTLDGDAIDGWLDQFDASIYERYPPLAAVAGWRHGLSGRADPAEAMADIAERSTHRERPLDSSASFESQRARLSALMCRRGARGILKDAEVAVSQETPLSQWRSTALWLLGEAHLLLGARQAAEDAFGLAITARSWPDRLPRTIARARCAALKADDGEWVAADALIAEPRARALEAGERRNGALLVVFAVDARIAIARGDTVRAREDLDIAQEMWPTTSHAAPWLSVDALLHLVQAYLSLSEIKTAQAVLRHAEQIARRRPDMGTLSVRLIAVRDRVADASSTLVGSSVLTPAELRVVPFLPTHLSFQEIADRLTISRNTVKTHAMSIYGKLWASSRNEAVRRAVELGLVEPNPLLAEDPVR
ncbi:MAG: LuxR C-terminal-related transcriptional regulator, partial [Chloroflexota bacterium]